MLASPSTVEKDGLNVVFENHKIDITGDVAVAMGTYYFTNATDGSKAKVEYTFGYKRNADGKVRIFLHHSSVPYSVPAATASAAITEEEVKSVQAAWANAIKSISKTYLDGGDYVAAAAKAAGELYGYGHTNVLFKPTKAAEAQFRPTASDAMSYFVGHMKRSRRVISRMLALPSTVARDGQTWFLTTTKSMSLAMLPLPWATTSSPALQMEARPKLSTLSATRRMRTAGCASSSTTPQCHLWRSPKCSPLQVWRQLTEEEVKECASSMGQCHQEYLQDLS